MRRQYQTTSVSVFESCRRRYGEFFIGVRISPSRKLYGFGDRVGVSNVWRSPEIRDVKRGFIGFCAKIIRDLRRDNYGSVKRTL